MVGCGDSMEVVSVTPEDMSKYGKVARGRVYSAHVKITDISLHAKELIAIISDVSWIDKLGAVEKASFSATSKRTIEKLVNDVLRKVDDKISEEFGEYMISATAQLALELKLNHTRIPLAELLKEKVSGNPGFDFHTESTSNLIAFGEAKYSGSSNPYSVALKQIATFVNLEKDNAELHIIKNFVTKNAVKNAINGSKAYIAAFSINGKSPQDIISNALGSDAIDALLVFPELYVIGVEVNA
jgi:hypothetical protein